MIRWVFMVVAFLCTRHFRAAPSWQAHNSRLTTDPNKPTPQGLAAQPRAEGNLQQTPSYADTGEVTILDRCAKYTAPVRYWRIHPPSPSPKMRSVLGVKRGSAGGSKAKQSTERCSVRLCRSSGLGVDVQAAPFVSSLSRQWASSAVQAMTAALLLRTNGATTSAGVAKFDT
jgi:hypothetical protein